MTKPQQIVIVMDGGIIQQVLSTEPVQYLIIDYDKDGDRENMVEVPQDDGTTAKAYTYPGRSDILSESELGKLASIGRTAV